MTSPLETARHPETLRRVCIEPVTRVEGHGKVTLLLDEDNQIRQARLHIVEFRGFEKFIQGRPYWELPVLVQRLCGICPVSHHLAAAKATDQLVGVDTLTPTAEKVRRLMHYGQTLQSHALHFFHLSSPDLLFGFDDAVRPPQHRRRHPGPPADRHPGRAAAQVRPGGHPRHRRQAHPRDRGRPRRGQQVRVSPEERDFLLPTSARWSSGPRGPSPSCARFIWTMPKYHEAFGRVDANTLSLIRPDGAFELYHGGLRARDPDGATIFDHVDYRDYGSVPARRGQALELHEVPLHRRNWDLSWAGIASGPSRGSTTVTASIPRWRRRSARPLLRPVEGRPQQAALAYHWARLIELLYCAEAIEGLLQDPDIGGTELQVRGERASKGHRRGGGPPRDPVPRLRGGRRRPGDPGQPDRLHHQQQSGDERVHPPGGEPIS